MTAFAVIAPTADDRLGNAVTEHFGNGNNYTIAPGQYFVFAPKLTTDQVAETLGVRDGGVGRVLVMRVTTYAGWHKRGVWEWLNARLSDKADE
jgi:hypothetical protein